MMFFLVRLWIGRFTGPLLKLGLLALAVLSFGAIQRREGAKNSRLIDKGKDHEKALSIDARIDTHLADRVRRLDDAGYRD